MIASLTTHYCHSSCTVVINLNKKEEFNKELKETKYKNLQILKKLELIKQKVEPSKIELQLFPQKTAKKNALTQNRHNIPQKN